ncbi:hypothetical protein K432DRAFT_382165 [Lepidopterella palustris CBS 459.81]|uniref:F-box domain-containing protein n=1 Tax=Lepidopterella palustris CBS 459.81 TaxID=1314670 RepID=A0A8E2EAI9_9PEZI|nr:hypothetical protein K432DRAFT_382165 [Lepidopterella palustris CBS 459.81]
MVEHAISLPCRTHPKHCNDHKFWSSQHQPQSSSINTIPPSWISQLATSAYSRIRHNLRKQSLSTIKEVQPKPDKIQSLPVELLQQIADYLPADSKAAFALTCHKTARAIGSQSWTEMSLGGSWYKQLEFLDLLQRDLPPLDWWRCRQCMNLHRRSWLGPSQQGGFLARWWKRRCQVGELKYGLLDDPIYAIGFDHVQLVMDRHFNRRGRTSLNGICIDSLKCSGTRIFPADNTTNIVLKYYFEPRIVVDRLLLHSSYRFEPHRTMFLNNTSLIEATVLDFLGGFDFHFCNHCSTKLVREIENHREPNGMQYQSCPFCPTEYGMKLDVYKPTDDRQDTLQSVKIDVWQNLGSGRSPLDPKWQHLAKSKYGRGSPYTYKRYGQIREAFQRVYCSTLKEFEKQMEGAALEKQTGCATSEKQSWWYAESLHRYTLAHLLPLGRNSPYYSLSELARDLD